MRTDSLQGRRLHAAAYVVIPCFLLSACATDKQKTEGQGAGAGAILGALVGVAITHNVKGAAIGGALGAGVGYGVGHQVAETKEHYAQREQILRGSAQRAEQLAQYTRQQNAVISGDVAQLELTVQSLQTQQASAEARHAAVVGNSRRAAALLNGVTLQLQQVKDEIARQQAALAADAQQARQTGHASPPEGARLVQVSIHDLQANQLDLESNQRSLEEARAQLQLIDSRRAY
jgi:Glycine zipper